MKVTFQTIKKEKVFIMLFLALVGFAVGTGVYGSRQYAFFPNFFRLFGSAEQAQDEKQVIQVVSEESQVIDVVKRATPAVVSIVASADAPILERCYEEYGSGDPFFGDFFNFRVPSYCQKGTERKRIGAGSGFIVSADGYILTNRHVVDSTEAEYTIFLNDEVHKDKKVRAKVLAKDPTNDIAILKIEETNLPYLEFGDSSALQVGQTAIAIGYALGEFDNTVSKGVVSGLARSITAGSPFGRSEQLEGIIQTDAAINPGNSGGPLLDIAGKVIGMNVATANAENISFAIPINDAKKVFDDVRATGQIQRAYLGVRYVVINEEIQEKNSLLFNYGALISRGEEIGDLAIIPGSPADKAGLMENDIILEADGTKIENQGTLTGIIAKKRIGDTVKLKIYHKGEERIVEVVLAERAE